jgi:hypothetical protein
MGVTYFWRYEMNERIKELAVQAGDDWDHTLESDKEFLKKFAELIVRECVNTLEFHGFEDAVPYIKWMATNKLGVE